MKTIIRGILAILILPPIALFIASIMFAAWLTGDAGQKLENNGE